MHGFEDAERLAFKKGGQYEAVRIFVERHFFVAECEAVPCDKVVECVLLDIRFRVYALTGDLGACNIEVPVEAGAFGQKCRTEYGFVTFHAKQVAQVEHLKGLVFRAWTACKSGRGTKDVFADTVGNGADTVVGNEPTKHVSKRRAKDDGFLNAGKKVALHGLNWARKTVKGHAETASVDVDDQAFSKQARECEKKHVPENGGASEAHLKIDDEVFFPQAQGK